METKDYFTIGLSGCALLTTIVWNLLNRWHTDKVARQIRADAFRFDEWKGQRAEVLRTLRSLDDCFDRLHVLSDGGHSLPDLKQSLSDEGRLLTVAHNALLRELERIGPEWPPLAYGVEASGESDWDQVHSRLYEAGIQNDPGISRNRVAQIAGHARSIRFTIEAALKDVTARHDPEVFQG